MPAHLWRRLTIYYAITQLIDGTVETLKSVWARADVLSMRIAQE